MRTTLPIPARARGRPLAAGVPPRSPRPGDGGRIAAGPVPPPPRPAAEQAEARLSAALHAAVADTPAAAVLRACLRELCGAAGWPAGRATVLAGAGATVWFAADPALHAAPACAWPGGAARLAASSRRAAWTPAAGQDHDAVLCEARGRGLGGVLAVPLAADGEAVAVLELFAPADGEPDAALLALAGRAADRAAPLLRRACAAEDTRRKADTVAAALECSPVPTATLAADGTVTLWNTAAAATFGIRAEEVTGQLGGCASWTPLLEAPREVLRSHVAAEADLRWETPDGRSLLVHVTGAPLLDGAGRLTGAVAMLEDVTERRQAARTHERMLMLEHAARVRAESAEQRAALLGYAGELLDAGFEHLQADACPALTAVASLVVPTLADYCRVDLVDEDGAFAVPAVADSANPEAGAARPWPRGGGHPAGQVVGEGRPLLVEDASAAGLRPFFTRPALRRSLPRPLASLVVVPLVARGRTLGALTLAMTDSGRRQDADDLRLAQELAMRIALALDNARLFREATAARVWRDELLAMVSHDLRSPLNVVHMGTHALLHAWPAEPASREGQAERRQLELVGKAAERMRRMLHDLLDAAQVDAGELRVDAVEQPAARMLRQAAELHGMLAEDADVHLRVEAPDDGVVVMADPERVLQVLSNLLGNAVKFSRRGGTVVLSAAVRRREVRFSVADEGAGIAPELLPHVFDRFWRGRGAAGGGAGLGLAIARGIVQAHGGRIWAESRPGAGSTFHFTLPRPDRQVPGAKSQVPSS